MRNSKKRSLGVTAVSLFMGALIFPIASSVQADTAIGTSVPVSDATMINQITALNTSIAGLVQTLNKANGIIADNRNANEKTNTIALTTAAEAMKYVRPVDQSPCDNAGSVAAGDQDNASTAALAQAFAQSFARPESPLTQAQEIKIQQCKLFGPTNTSDPEASALKALCGGVSASADHARQDRTIESLLGPLQYSVVPGSVVLTNGVYQPAPITTTPATTSQYQYAAAMTYCQHITPKQPKPPQAPSSGNATVALTTIGDMIDTESGTSIVAGTCANALAERMQFTSASNVGSRFTEQTTRCTEDLNSHIIDAKANSDCQANGRSNLQADHDRAYRIKSAEFQKSIMANLTTDTQQIVASQAMQDMAAFQQRLLAERQALIAAMATANDITQPRTATPVTQQ